MILEFAVENFRSIKDRQVFSMIAEPSKAKGENVFEVPLANGSTIRLLKTAVIYGANASGKSNLIKALNRFISLIKSPTRGADRSLREYDPFLFSRDTRSMPTCFELTFILQEVKYEYSLSFNTSILSENLSFFPKGQRQKVFNRLIDTNNELIHKAKLGTNFGKKEIEVFHNQPIITKFGFDIPHDLLSPVYYYFSTFEISNNSSSVPNSMRINNVASRFSEGGKNFLLKRLEKLIHTADTKIEGLDILQEEEARQNFKLKLVNGEAIREPVVDIRMRTKIYSRHKVFENGIQIDTEILDFNEASEGTKALFWRGGLILEKLEKGGVLVFDELDNSLHPKLVRFLVKLFSNPKSNPNNAQLIFATHEVTLLDRDLFRTDQIWITEKNEFGETELYSVQDFEGVREDIPFYKWYMAGKFGGQPKIDDIESIFSNE